MLILIYNDDGASDDCVKALTQWLPNQTIELISSAELQKKTWMSKTNLLIMPGGRSLPFYKKLGALGNQNIKKFVEEQGGSYFGICAGAYYACRKTIFAKGLPLELILPGELNFFEGNAIGPVFAADEFYYHSERGARIVEIIFENNDVHRVYCNGGCYFENTNQARVLARYQLNKQPAIIVCTVGLGRVLLSGVHPELSPFLSPISLNAILT